MKKFRNLIGNLFGSTIFVVITLYLLCDWFFGYATGYSNYSHFIDISDLVK